MPLRVEIQSHKINFPDIVPGLPGSFSHLDPKTPYILVVSCNSDDSGGLVYRGNPETSQRILNNAVRLMTEEAEIEAVIEQGGTYKRELITKRGLVELTLTHYQNNPPSTAF